jgi:hypothetical protein
MRSISFCIILSLLAVSAAAQQKQTAPKNVVAALKPVSPPKMDALATWRLADKDAEGRALCSEPLATWSLDYFNFSISGLDAIYNNDRKWLKAMFDEMDKSSCFRRLEGTKGDVGLTINISGAMAPSQWTGYAKVQLAESQRQDTVAQNTIAPLLYNIAGGEVQQLIANRSVRDDKHKSALLIMRDKTEALQIGISRTAVLAMEQLAFRHMATESRRTRDQWVKSRIIPYYPEGTASSDYSIPFALRGSSYNLATSNGFSPCKFRPRFVSVPMPLTVQLSNIRIDVPTILIEAVASYHPCFSATAAAQRIELSHAVIGDTSMPSWVNMDGKLSSGRGTLFLSNRHFEHARARIQKLFVLRDPMIAAFENIDPRSNEAIAAFALIDELSRDYEAACWLDASMQCKMAQRMSL